SSVKLSAKRDMSGTSRLLQRWQVPSSSLFFGRSKLSKGLYLVPVRVMYPMSCFCKQMQTTTYAIVKGSYVSNPQNQQENKCISKITHGNAVCRYSTFSTEESKEGLAYK
ncbi:hypothetical protein H5410_051001, partial [Solanum commersonii]